MSIVALHNAITKMAKSIDIIKDTHGNISYYEGQDNEMLYIKPSGVQFDMIDIRDISVVDFDTEELYSGLKPSVDLHEHIAIYKNNPWVKSICHTHSPYATAFAMYGKRIYCESTEQADYFGGEIDCLEYVGMDWGSKVFLGPEQNAILLSRHGCLTFADSPMGAVELAIALENVAFKNYLMLNLSDGVYPQLPMTFNPKEWHERYTKSYGQKKDL